MDETNVTEPVAADDHLTEDDYVEPGESACRFAYVPPTDGDAA